MRMKSPKSTTRTRHKFCKYSATIWHSGQPWCSCWNYLGMIRHDSSTSIYTWAWTIFHETPVVPPVILPCTSTIGKSSIILLMWKWMMRNALGVAEEQNIPPWHTMTAFMKVDSSWFCYPNCEIHPFHLRQNHTNCCRNRRNRRDTVLMYIWRVGQVKLRSFIYFVGLNWCGMSCFTIVLWSRIHVDPHVVFFFRLDQS